MSGLWGVAWAFFLRDLGRVRPWVWIAEWFNAGLLVVFWYFLTRFVQVPSSFRAAHSEDYFTFSLIGLSFAQYVWRGFSVFVNRVKQERASGSLEPLWVTAYPFPLLVLFSGTWIFFASTIDAAVVLVMGKFLGASLGWSGMAQVLGVGLLTSWAMGALGLLTASWIIAFGQGDVFRPLLNQVIPLFSGAFFPIALFPGWLRGVAQWMPTTHALVIARGVLSGMESADALRAWIALVGLTVGLSLVGWAILTLAIRQARINGRLAAGL